MSSVFGKSAHKKLQGYVNSFVPVADQYQAIIFDDVEKQEFFQRRTVILTNGTGYLCFSTDVDYTNCLHEKDDYESEPVSFHLPTEAIKFLMNHYLLALERDREQLRAIQVASAPLEDVTYDFSNDPDYVVYR